MRPDAAAARLLLALTADDALDDAVLANLLDAEVRLTIDAGDASGGARTGRAAVTRALVAHLSRHPDVTLQVVHVNGAPGLAIRCPEGEVTGLISLRTGWRGRIIELWITTAPGKLARWNRVLPTDRPRPVTDPDATRSELVRVADTPQPRNGRNPVMKIVVIGGTGLIGSKVVELLTAGGHDAVAASPNSGVNTITGEGLAEALVDADVVVDVSNSPSFADDDVLAFFTTSTRNLLAAERAAGVGHHVALSVVGADRLPSSGYLRAKVAQEQLIRESGRPYSIVRATQFYEFVGRIADEATVDGVARLSTGLMQPIAAADVSAAVARVAAGTPVDAIIEIGGPERIAMDELVRRGLDAAGDPRQVVGDPEALYFGTPLSGDELAPGPEAQLSTTSFADWLAARSAAAAQ